MATPQEVLDCPMEGNDAGASTIREYVVALARGVWDEGEGFSGKRPFGNSSWEYEVYEALGKAGLIACSFDDHGYLDDFDRPAAHALVAAAIDALAISPTAATAGTDS